MKCQTAKSEKPGAPRRRQTVGQIGQIGPRLPGLSDRDLVARFAACMSVEDIARHAGCGAGEVTLRLVQLVVGDLGRVRPLPSRAAPGRRSAARDPQPPVLALAARALGGSLQRFGDRYFVDGDEMALRDIVLAARARGVRIRYPGIDPIPQAHATGPSAAGRLRRRGPVVAWLSGGGSR